MMDLLEAFLVATGQRAPASAAQADEAAVTLYDELTALARRLPAYIDPEMAQESASAVFLRLVLKAPSALRDPARLRGFLFRSVRNAALDRLRREKRNVPIEEFMLVDESWLAGSSALASAETDLIARERAQLVEWAETQVFDYIVPELGRRRRADARESFLKAFHQLRELLHQRTTVAELAGSTDKRDIDRVHQQHSRARRKLFDWQTHELADAGFDERQTTALTAVIAALRRTS